MKFNMTFLADTLEMNVENVAAVVFTGLIVVFIGLVLLIAFVSFLGKFFTKKPKAKKEKKITIVKEEKIVSSEKITPPVVEEGISDEVVAVIAAAIAAMGAKSGKKLALRSVRNAKPQRNAWATAGIMENTRPFF